MFMIPGAHWGRFKDNPLRDPRRESLCRRLTPFRQGVLTAIFRLVGPKMAEKLRDSRPIPIDPLINAIITKTCDIIIYRRGSLSVTDTKRG